MSIAGDTHTAVGRTQRKTRHSDFLTECVEICKSGDRDAIGRLSGRMEAYLRENCTPEKLQERIDTSVRQIQSGEMMTADEADEAIRRDLPWLRF